MPRAGANWATSLPTAPLAVFCTIQSPDCTSSESSRASALNGMEISCAAVSSLIASGTGSKAGRLGHEVLGPDTEGAAGDPLPDLQSLDALAERVDHADRLGARRRGQLGLESVACRGSSRGRGCGWARAACARAPVPGRVRGAGARRPRGPRSGLRKWCGRVRAWWCSFCMDPGNTKTPGWPGVSWVYPRG